MTRALTQTRRSTASRAPACRSSRASCALTSYGDEFADLPIAFAPQSIANGFGEYLAALGLTQLRIAETEKYAHVTYFFNGGIEAVYPGEDRILVPSPKVATYDLKPEMSALEVTDKLVAAIAQRQLRRDRLQLRERRHGRPYRQLRRRRKAVETLDACIGRVVDAARAAGGEVLITADHGNAETMYDPDTGQPHTAHTLNVVPLALRRPAGDGDRGRRAGGRRADASRDDRAPAARRHDRTFARPVLSC